VFTLGRNALKVTIHLVVCVDFTHEFTTCMELELFCGVSLSFDNVPTAIVLKRTPLRYINRGYLCERKTVSDGRAVQCFYSCLFFARCSDILYVVYSDEISFTSSYNYLVVA